MVHDTKHILFLEVFPAFIFPQTQNNAGDHQISEVETIVLRYTNRIYTLEWEQNNWEFPAEGQTNGWFCKTHVPLKHHLPSHFKPLKVMKGHSLDEVYV